MKQHQANQILTTAWIWTNSCKRQARCIYTSWLNLDFKLLRIAFPDLMQILCNHKEGKTRKRRLANIDDEQRVLLDVNNNLLWSIH